MSCRQAAEAKLLIWQVNWAGLILTADHSAGALNGGIDFGITQALQTMRQLIVQQLDYDLTPVAGLSLVGHYLNALRPMFKRLDAALRVKGGVVNSDVVRSYLGLLVQGKSDFDAVENFRGDTFYKQALGIGLLPSSPTLRQRMDARSVELFDFVPPMIETLLAGQRPRPCGSSTPKPCATSSSSKASWRSQRTSSAGMSALSPSSDLVALVQ